MTQLNATGLQTHPFTLEDRFRYGCFSVAELLELKSRSNSGFYQDVKDGLVLIEKRGRKTIVRGPVARRYLLDLPIDSSPEQGG